MASGLRTHHFEHNYKVQSLQFRCKKGGQCVGMERSTLHFNVTAHKCVDSLRSLKSEYTLLPIPLFRTTLRLHTFARNVAPTAKTSTSYIINNNMAFLLQKARQNTSTRIRTFTVVALAGETSPAREVYRNQYPKGKKHTLCFMEVNQSCLTSFLDKPYTHAFAIRSALRNL